VSRLPSLQGEVQERMVGMQPDQDESDDDGAPETGAAGGADGWESMDED
jgi:periodic tryptophan protein 1